MGLFHTKRNFGIADGRPSGRSFVSRETLRSFYSTVSSADECSGRQNSGPHNLSAPVLSQALLYAHSSAVNTATYISLHKSHGLSTTKLSQTAAKPTVRINPTVISHETYAAEFPPIHNHSPGPEPTISRRGPSEQLPPTAHTPEQCHVKRPLEQPLAGRV